MTSAYHLAADHFLTLEGRAACRRARAAQPQHGAMHRTSWADAEHLPFHKGSDPGRDLKWAGKGEVVSSTAQMAQKCHSARMVFGVGDSASPGTPPGCSPCVQGVSTVWGLTRSAPLPLASSCCVKESQQASYSSGSSLFPLLLLPFFSFLFLMSFRLRTAIYQQAGNAPHQQEGEHLGTVPGVHPRP